MVEEAERAPRGGPVRISQPERDRARLRMGREQAGYEGFGAPRGRYGTGRDQAREPRRVAHAQRVDHEEHTPLRRARRGGHADHHGVGRVRSVLESEQRVVSCEGRAGFVVKREVRSPRDEARRGGADDLLWGLGLRVQGIGFRVQDLGSRVQDLGFRI